MNLTIDQVVAIINQEGKREEEYVVVNPKVNRQGMITLSKDGANVEVHPKRIILNDVTPVPTRESVEVRKVLKEKSMSDVTDVAPVAEAPAPVVTTPVEAAPAAAAPSLSVPPAPNAGPAFDRAVYAGYGELYEKDTSNGKLQVKSYTLILPTVNKYLSFNVYNGTFGKNGKAPQVQEVLAGTATVTNGVYAIKDIEKLRAKLLSGSYTKVE